MKKNLDLIIKELYERKDYLHRSRKDTYKTYKKKWPWWPHPKNLEFILSLIGVIADDHIYYERVPDYLRATMKWFNYLRSNPLYQDKFSKLSYYQLFDYLCNTDSSEFILLYNEFNQNMGNPNKKSRKEWIYQHFNYLPKTNRGFNKNNVILDYNWRLSHQGNLSKYWGSIRPDQKGNIRNSFLSNRRDAGKSNEYDVIMDRDLLIDILDILPPLYQIIILFMSYTGLRLNDALKCLIFRWKDLQYLTYQGIGRYFIHRVNTQKRDNPIYFLFISRDLIDLLNHYVPGKFQDKIRLLLQKSNIFFMNKEKQISLLTRNVIKELKKAFHKVKNKYPNIKSYQRVRTHLLRKYFTSKTNLGIDRHGNTLDDSILGKKVDDYLRYIAGHQPSNPLFIIYEPSLRDPQINLMRFVKYLEPSVDLGFSQKKISALLNRKKEILDFFQLKFNKYYEKKIKKDYFSYINIIKFFIYYQFKISLEEVNELILDLIQQGILKKFGSYYSFDYEGRISGIEKYKIIKFVSNFPMTDIGIKFFELYKIMDSINIINSEKEFSKIIEGLKELKILYEIDSKIILSISTMDLLGEFN